jgi:hypothetical protein
MFGITPNNSMPSLPTKGNPKASALGCLTRLLLFCTLAGLLIVAVTGIVAPWAFFLGGRFHLLPVWQGVGRFRAASGDYSLYFWVSPSPGGRRLNLPAFRGWAVLCSPRAEQFQLRVSANFMEPAGLDTQGKEFRADVYRRPWYSQFIGPYDDRPRLNLRGRWRGQELIMNDGGSLSRMFQPNGTLFQGPSRAQPAARETLQIIFREVGWLGWWKGCEVPAAPHVK